MSCSLRASKPATACSNVGEASERILCYGVQSEHENVISCEGILLSSDENACLFISIGFFGCFIVVYSESPL